MKKLFIALALPFCLTAGAQGLVLLHTNDTHSAIDVSPQGMGGILPRKAIIDSVRAAEKNVLLIDAGDAVQGSLYFKFFRGDVENPLFNMLGYDIRILGNHEFDNGLEELARQWKGVEGERLSANYDFSNTPARGLFKPYTVKEVEGKKIGFIGVNIDPASLISKQNYAGMKFADPLAVTDSLAGELKEKGVDLVVVVSHIGYKMANGKPDDVSMASKSKNIDIIIGGHSHTVVSPDDLAHPHWIANADGRDVLVVQTGKNGNNLGYIKIDPSAFSKNSTEYRLIPVTDRFGEKDYSQEIRDFLKPYRAALDSIDANVLAVSVQDMPNGVNVGALPNWTADCALYLGQSIADSLRIAGVSFPKVDGALMNVGGIRHPVHPGPVTEGMVLSIYPFSNKLRLIRIKGKDLKNALAVGASKGGEAVSGQFRVIYDSAGRVRNALLDMKPIADNKDYCIVTIDYLAEGNDDMVPLKNSETLWEDNRELSSRIADYLRYLSAVGLPVQSDSTPRYVTIP